MSKRYLSYNILKLYDSSYIRRKIEQVFDLFDYLDSVIYEFEYPTITSTGTVRYEQFITGVNSSKLENFVLEKLCFELRGNDYKRRLLMTKITMALKKLNPTELLVFKYSYYEQLEIYEICEKISYSERKIIDIKKSASVKFLLALHLDQECLKGGDKKLVNDYFKEKVAIA